MSALAAVERLARRVAASICSAVISLVDDSGNAQRMQVRLGSDEIRDGAPRIAEYGFVSNPPPGSDAVVIFIGGDRSNGIVIATGNQSARLKNLLSGESAMHDDQSQIIHITRTGIVIEAPLGLTINGNVTIVGDTTQTGAITATKEITSTLSGTHTLTQHKHGGVTTGAGQTATPTG